MERPRPPKGRPPPLRYPIRPRKRSLAGVIGPCACEDASVDRGRMESPWASFMPVWVKPSFRRRRGQSPSNGTGVKDGEFTVLRRAKGFLSSMRRSSAWWPGEMAAASFRDGKRTRLVIVFVCFRTGSPVPPRTRSSARLPSGPDSRPRKRGAAVQKSRSAPRR